MSKTYNDALEWAAKWIEDSLQAETNGRTIEFGKNMAMTLRAARADLPRATRETTVEQCLAELREMFPNHARRIQVTETLLTLNSVTIVVGGQSATYNLGSLQQNLADCMAIAHRWHKALQVRAATRTEGEGEKS